MSDVRDSLIIQLWVMAMGLIVILGWVLYTEHDEVKQGSAIVIDGNVYQCKQVEVK